MDRSGDVVNKPAITSPTLPLNYLFSIVRWAPRTFCLLFFLFTNLSTLFSASDHHFIHARTRYIYIYSRTSQTPSAVLRIICFVAISRRNVVRSVWHRHTPKPTYTTPIQLDRCCWLRTLRGSHIGIFATTTTKKRKKKHSRFIQLDSIAQTFEYFRTRISYEKTKQRRNAIIVSNWIQHQNYKRRTRREIIQK